MDTSDFGLFPGFSFLVVVLLAACLEGSLPFGFCPDLRYAPPRVEANAPDDESEKPSSELHG